MIVVVAITARPPKVCAFDEATCLNGDCIRKEFVCNGQYDCADQSDEMRCSKFNILVIYI